MRKLLFLVGSVILATSTSLSGCSAPAPSEDEQFDKDWVEDFENDTEEAVAEEQEVAELDELDDLDDVEEPSPGGEYVLPGTEATLDPEGGPGPGEDPPPEGTLEAEEALAEAPAPGALVKKRPRKHGPISIMEDDPQFSGRIRAAKASDNTYDKATSDARLDRAKALGADVIRIMSWWRDHVPGDPQSTTKPSGFVSSKPDSYDWRELDMQFEGARARGMKVMVTITAGPMPFWASEEPQHCVNAAKNGAWSCAWKPRPREFAAWVTAVGRHIKQKGYRLWGVTFVNEPNVSHFLEDESNTKLARRYRKLWFHARKAFRKTAGVKTRVFFSDQANSTRTFDPGAGGWPIFNNSLCLSLEKDAEFVPDFCPEKRRRVEVTGIAFHPYAATAEKARDSVNFLHRLVDEAAREDRLPKRRGLYMTEAGFLTARSKDADSLGAPTIVTVEEQARYLNEAERFLSRNPRVKSVAQYELVDEGRGGWDCGLMYVQGAVTTTSGVVFTGDLIYVNLDDFVVVRSASGVDRKIPWSDIANETKDRKKIQVFGPGAEKPAYAAYHLGINVADRGDKVEIWGASRADSGAGFVVEGLFGSGTWQEIKTVKTDALGYGRAVISKNGATQWRLRFGTALSRVTK